MSDSKKKAEEKALSGLKKKATPLLPQQYVDGILKGDRNLLSQAITLIESTNAAHRIIAEEIINLALPHSGKSIRIGITGVPGVGKSSLIETFGTYLTSIDKKVAVLAIDPTSPLSRGSILGDKTRMENLSVNQNAFIRPSAAADSLGGVARKTREALLLCEAAGFDIIIIETVGVGQSETAVHRMTDFFMLLMLAGAGDQLQGIKRGIMELCDALFITKADGDNLKNVTRAKADYISALHFYPPKPSGWIPKVDACSSLDGSGMDKTWDVVNQHHEWLTNRGMLEQIRLEQDLEWMQETLRDKILDSFYADAQYRENLIRLEKQIREKQITPFKAAEELFELGRN